MADNYLQFSMAFPLKTDAEKEWCVETMNALTAFLDSGLDVSTEEGKQRVRALGDLGRRALEEEWYACDFEWSIDKVDPKASDWVAEMWLYAEESGDPDQVAAFLQAYLQKFNPKGSLWFSWAYSCSKMRVNEFGGGAVVVRADGIKHLDVQHWAQEEAESSELRRELPRAHAQR